MSDANDNALPPGSARRKEIPLARGVLDYFPAALAAVAELSRAGNEKHNPGEELHHARGKSSDHADCILRHLVDRGRIDPEDNILHDVKVAWRALALLQEELERRGAPLARGARLPEPEEEGRTWKEEFADGRPPEYTVQPKGAVWVSGGGRPATRAEIKEFERQWGDQRDVAAFVWREQRRLEQESIDAAKAARCDNPSCKECGGPA